MAPRPRRSALYMPGSNARALEKARSLPADVIILDLEDSVAPEQKASARAQVAAAVTTGGFGGRELVIRMNGLGSEWHEADLASAAAAGPDAVLLPKAGSPGDIAALRQALSRHGAPASVEVWAMIETPVGVLRAGEIALAAAAGGANRLGCFVAGTNDLVKETRAELDAERTAALYWLSATVTAARAGGIDVLDGVYNNFRDLDGLERECRQGRRLGMDGKTVIHPDQIPVCNRLFAPSEDEIAAARRIVQAFAEPENAGKGAINLDGRMVELLHADMARRTLAIAEAIAARTG